MCRAKKTNSWSVLDFSAQIAGSSHPGVSSSREKRKEKQTRMSLTKWLLQQQWKKARVKKLAKPNQQSEVRSRAMPLDVLNVVFSFFFSCVLTLWCWFFSPLCIERARRESEKRLRMRDMFQQASVWVSEQERAWTWIASGSRSLSTLYSPLSLLLCVHGWSPWSLLLFFFVRRWSLFLSSMGRARWATVLSLQCSRCFLWSFSPPASFLFCIKNERSFMEIKNSPKHKSKNKKKDFLHSFPNLNHFTQSAISAFCSLHSFPPLVSAKIKIWFLFSSASSFPLSRTPQLVLVFEPVRSLNKQIYVWGQDRVRTTTGRVCLHHP